MNRELIKAFNNLNIEDKRNQLSNELLSIHALITNIEKMHNIVPITNVKNYESALDQDKDEEEMLTYFYEDIYNIKQELITIITLFSNRNE